MEAICLTHEAMKTTFACRFFSVENRELAPSLAMECFHKVDEIEALLNRYLEGSEIHQINSMSKGDELFLHPLTHRCLLLGQEMYFKSRGVFDITLGVKIEQLKNGSKDQGDQEGGWEIDPERPKILCGQAGRQLDLGGIGKGFALDVMAEYLRDWQPCDMVISAGASTQLVLGNREKRFELLGDSKRMIIGLEDLCLSASGIGIQGVHIVSPQGLEGQPTFRRAWCIAKGAAFADAWSTAAMLMELGELEDILAENDEVIKFICEGHDGVWVEVGPWGGGARWIDGD